MVSAATVLRWSQRTCRLMLFVSDSCCGGNYGGNGVKNRRGGAAAIETEAVARGGNRKRGSGSENIEAAEPAAEK
jgi:hypothetical protein